MPHSAEPDDRPAIAAHPISLRNLALVWLGGTLGCGLRAAIGLWLVGAGAFPLSTWLVNIVGSAVLGFLLEALSRRGPDTGTRRDWRLFAGTGVLGGFTTYSSFSVDTLHLIQAGHALLAIGYVGSTVLVGALGAYVGIVLGRRLVSP